MRSRISESECDSAVSRLNAERNGKMKIEGKNRPVKFVLLILYTWFIG